VLAEIEFKRRIKGVIDNEPSIRQTVNVLVAHSDESTDEKKREKAIFAVYIRNNLFAKKVDDELDR
jgi:hypothetical protein